MATWLVRERRKHDPRKVCIISKKGRPRWHPLWSGNPGIARHIDGAQILFEGPGSRHYIAGKTDERWTWFPHPDRQPGEVFLPPGPRPFAHSYVYVEPHIKVRASPNKDWGGRRYQAVVSALQAYQWVQCGQGPWLAGVTPVPTPDFRAALEVLRHAVLYVGPEGGMHHAAAALGVPAIVIFGGFISPDVTGYRQHTNFHGGGEPCGMRIPCSHCRDAMNAITVEVVVGAITTQLEKSYERTERSRFRTTA